MDDVLNQHLRDLPLSPQALTVLNALKSGRGLSNLLALTTLGVGSLSSRIAELRKAGHEISSEMTTGTAGKSYAVYRLESAAPPQRRTNNKTTEKASSR